MDMLVALERWLKRTPIYAQKRTATGGQIQLPFLPILWFAPSASQHVADLSCTDVLADFR
jgi:hypothetical protein